MNPHPALDRTFPLSGGSEPRPALRPPRLAALVAATPALAAAPSGLVLGNRAFLRAWAVRRLDASAAPLASTNHSTSG